MAAKGSLDQQVCPPKHGAPRLCRDTSAGTSPPASANAETLVQFDFVRQREGKLKQPRCGQLRATDEGDVIGVRREAHHQLAVDAVVHTAMARMMEAKSSRLYA